MLFMGTQDLPTSDHVRKLLAAFGLSFGHDSNAYTDFHRTVYTFEAPTTFENWSQKCKTEREESTQHLGKESGDGNMNVLADNFASIMKNGHTEGMDALEVVLHALFQIIARPIIPEGDPLENERNAVLSELQMRNTLEHRMDVNHYHQIHHENMIPNRFPIGKEELIQQWGQFELRQFYR